MATVFTILQSDRISLEVFARMSASTTRRGRPKGSGLDDRTQLEHLRKLLDRDPALKPTTAIKSLGISDPASIRRLRDKLRAGPDGIAVPTGTSEGGGSGMTRNAQSASLRDSNGTAQDGAAHVADSMSSRAQDAAVEWFAQWYGLGLRALSTTVEAQLAAFETMLRAPQVATVVRQHIVLNEHMMSMYASTPDVRKTLH
jgi:hypothetical protein